MNDFIKSPLFLIFVLVACMMSRVEASPAGGEIDAPVRIISADWQNIKGPRSEVFHECIGAGRAAEGLRAEW